MALAYILKSFNRFYGAVPSSVDVYTHQCSVLVSSKDLALMGSVITNNGIHPKTKKHILNPEQCQFIKRGSSSGWFIRILQHMDCKNRMRCCKKWSRWRYSYFNSEYRNSSNCITTIR